MKFTKVKQKCWNCELIVKQELKELVPLSNYESDDSGLLIPMAVQPPYSSDDMELPKRGRKQRKDKQKKRATVELKVEPRGL